MVSVTIAACCVRSAREGQDVLQDIPGWYTDPPRLRGQTAAGTQLLPGELGTSNGRATFNIHCLQSIDIPVVVFVSSCYCDFMLN